jgi:hypothetical protein
VLEEGEASALGALLRQEELAIMKAISTLQLSRARLRDLSNAMAANMKRKALTSIKVKPCGKVVDLDQSSHKILQQPAGKKKAGEVSSSDGVPELAARRSTPSALVVEGSTALSAGDELTAGTRRQPGPIECGPAYAAVLAGHSDPCQEIGPLNPIANA